MPSQQHVAYWTANAQSSDLNFDGRWHSLGRGSHGTYLAAYRHNREQNITCYLCGRSFWTDGNRLHLIFTEEQRIHLHIHEECIARGITGHAEIPSRYRQESVGGLLTPGGSHDSPAITISRPLSRSRAATVAPAQILLGADPELELAYEGNRIAASSIGLEAGGSAQTSYQTHGVGADGAGGPIELRPEPGSSAHVTDSLRARLIRLRDGYLVTRWPGLQRVELIAGCGRTIPVGGHIHVSGIGQEPSADMLVTLDATISRPLYSASDSRLRGNSRSYGGYSQWRSQDHGGWEYRTPPSWLAHPDLTAGALAVMQVLAGCQRDRSVAGWLPADVILHAGDQFPAVDAFYGCIDGLRSQHTTLEQLDVLTTWDLRPQVRMSDETSQVIRYSVAASGDVNCRAIVRGFESTLPLRLVGARAGRDGEVWLSPELVGRTNLRLWSPAIWTYSAVENTIFMSAVLRNDIPAARIMLRRIITTLGAA